MISFQLRIYRILISGSPLLQIICRTQNRIHIEPQLFVPFRIRTVRSCILHTEDNSGNFSVNPSQILKRMLKIIM